MTIERTGLGAAQQAAERAVLEDWIRQRLSGHGRTLDGSVEQVHARPWGTVYRGATKREDVYLKVVWRPQIHEAFVNEVLGRFVPDLVPAILGIDAERGWILMADAGEPLGRRDESAQLDILPRALGRYAALQLAMTDQVGNLLSGGVPDHRQLANHLRRLLKVYPTARDDSLKPGELRRLAKLETRIAAAEEALSQLLRPSIQHDDLHSGNVLVDRDGTTRIFDWGDVNIATPLLSLAVLLAQLEESFGRTLPDARIEAIVGAYLEPLEESAGKDLRPSVPDARLLGMVSRAMTWERVAAHIDPGERAQFPDPVAECLRAVIRLAA
jgi:Phosphotransferase enzyme family